MAPACVARSRRDRREPGLDYRFPRSRRLHGKALIDRVYRQGERRRHQPLMACLLRRPDDPGAPGRVAISIAKACGCAVERNAIRRRIREAYRLMQHQMPLGTDILLVVRPHRRLTLRQYQERLSTLLEATIPGR